MPTYVYQCREKKCKFSIELIHTMSECDKPTDEIIKEITCPKHNIIAKRIIFEPQLAGSSGGTFKTEHQLVKEKQKQRKIRSRHEFHNDKLDKLPPGFDKEHFKRKYKDVKRKDHEKMK